MLFNRSKHALRHAITQAYRLDENTCVETLLTQATLPSASLQKIKQTASALVQSTREYQKKQGKLDALLHQYDLSTDEGIALMCLAEALLRIPDKETADRLISDKISTANWKAHLSTDNAFFVNATTWSLLLTGKIYSPLTHDQKGLTGTLSRLISRSGAAMIRPMMLKMMQLMGSQFVMGETISAALTRAEEQEAMGYCFSYDMLGEAARTAEDANYYLQAYEQAITAIGNSARAGNPAENPGISIKLSALHPRYEFAKHERVLKEVTPLLLALAQQAKHYNIGLTVDAEESDRLELSLDIIEKVFADPSLAGWEGFGLAVQAYQKRAPYVIDWLADLAKKQKKRFMVRLVKGAYWDAEIKQCQVLGLANYPVFTRKNSTDVSYLACAKKLLAQPECFYPQFGTHNAYSVAAIMEMAGAHRDFEFQCLHGMGRPLYDHIVNKDTFNLPCRIYAPVGTHKDLLAYLVRRLLENGANTSFVNVLADDTTPIDKIITDPVARVQSLASKPHPKIPLPKNIYHDWQNSQGVDLSDASTVENLQQAMQLAETKSWQAGPIIGGKHLEQEARAVMSPSNLQQVIGHVSKAREEDMLQALNLADAAKKSWTETSVAERAALLERAADLFEKNLPELIALLCREGGKCIPDCLSEVRETIDYCRYYAFRARRDLMPRTLPGPTGELNQLFLHGRGTVLCISPWNFPLAIFTGQVVAALVAGNTVIAKPSEQTPLVAHKAIEILHQAGIPKEVLQFLPGRGSVIGATLLPDARVAGVMFTGSTETAQTIQQTLANRSGPLGFLIAETGGQNAMIVDSSALPEQVVMDVAQSAFNSAGQRCSALRVLFLQEEIAPKVITMLKGYMAELALGDPSQLSTDIGPVIDPASLDTLQQHFARMSREATLIAQVPSYTATPGHYFTPSAFELKSLHLLEREVFGPILHIIRYAARDLDKVMADIIQTGYGLTLGIHSRIDATIHAIADHMPVGNIYVNRNMIGAVVGVQPFGGERLSGTGPKAGGPHYLPRLCVERTVSMNTTAVGGNARLVSLLEE